VGVFKGSDSVRSFRFWRRSLASAGRCETVVVMSKSLLNQITPKSICFCTSCCRSIHRLPVPNCCPPKPACHRWKRASAFCRACKEAILSCCLISRCVTPACGRWRPHGRAATVIRSLRARRVALVTRSCNLVRLIGKRPGWRDFRCAANAGQNMMNRWIGASMPR
jgi:hypothetical protein